MSTDQPTESDLREGIRVLGTVLRRLRWDDQGGYPGLYKGEWDFASTSLPQTTPAELDALFKLAGIVPDEIVPLGSCRECAHASDGRERGYANPCGGCKRPRMSNFVPLASVRGAPMSDPLPLWFRTALRDGGEWKSPEELGWPADAAAVSEGFLLGLREPDGVYDLHLTASAGSYRWKDSTGAVSQFAFATLLGETARVATRGDTVVGATCRSATRPNPEA